MAGEKMRCLKFQDNSWWVRVTVPKDVKHAFPKGELWHNLRTSNPHDAARMAHPIISGFKKQIADARAGRPSIDAELKIARAALRRWAYDVHPLAAFGQFTRYPTQPAGPGKRRPPMRAFQQHGTDTHLLERFVAGKEEWDDIFDDRIAALISYGEDDLFQPAAPVVQAMRREVGVEILRMIRRRDRMELAAQSEAITEAAKVYEGDAGPIEPLPMPKALPAPSLTLHKLHKEWLATLTVVEKEKGRLNHQIRRLIEVVGDKPANHLTRQEVREVMGLVARFPGRKRSAKLNALPMRKLIEQYEADKEAIVKRNLAKKQGEPLEDVPVTLATTTVGEWFSGWRRMYEYALEEGYVDASPFEGRLLQQTSIRGAKSTDRRQYTEAEIKTIFSAPLFTGFEGEGETGYRNNPGANIVRDAKYWLPILALFHGNRLTEFAAMPHADLKQTEAGSWYFDLRNRKVKNKPSQRVIPLHPKVVQLGFLDYVKKLREGNSPWLFPDLDHESEHGPGHAFSKWWAHWMDKHGLTDPSITYHSWRHTWKRAARQSEVKEELHDVISGHKNASVGRSYGSGAAIEPLAREMAKIVFPAFPDLPVPPVGR